MHRTRWIRTSLAATSLAVAAITAAPALAGASTAPGTSSSPATTNLEQHLMQQLQSRQTQLTALTNDVTNAKALTPSDQASLEQKLTQATTSIDGLVQSVPGDTRAQLRAARRTMIRDNRVFLVLTPQVYEVVESDTVASEADGLAAQEPTLLGEVNQSSGKAGYKNALGHYNRYVAAVKRAQAETGRVSDSLLAQTPERFPRDRRVFVRANHRILAASDALAKAGYDETIIALATGGYTGA